MTPSPARPQRHWRWAGAALVIVVFIFAESSRPSPSIGGALLDNLASDLAHFLLYCTLAYCFRRASGDRSLRGALLAALAASLYGVSDELHQSFVPSRDPSVSDAAIDCVAALAGAAVSLRFTSEPGSSAGS